ncbi:hypothetical protein ACFVWZ_32595 [Streptomyces sp. NPDC058200]|uniref:hypothetical protein n=1 Tax=Streptomyces sp. NPDC058200 TaxID=3346378 RepID=UPI0036E6920B
MNDGAGFMRIWNKTRAAGMVLALSFGLLACGGGEDEGLRFIGAEKVCDGIFSGDVARAVETAVGDRAFFRTSDDALEDAASGVKEFYADGQTIVRIRKLCSIKGEARGSGRMDIHFSLYRADDALRTTHSASESPYQLGKRALAGFDGSRLYFECVSPQMNGSGKQPARVYAGMSLDDREVEDTQALREANLTALHAASLALAKELKCENNGGLPEKAVLRPK